MNTPHSKTTKKLSVAAYADIYAIAAATTEVAYAATVAACVWWVCYQHSADKLIGMMIACALLR